MSTSIARQIRQTKPFSSHSQAAVIGLMCVADLLQRQASTVVAAEQLTLPQYNILRILRGAGCDGLPTMEIGERLVSQAPGLTRLLDRLEKDGLVERERSVTDRRQVYCRLTDAGLQRVNALEPAVEAFDDSSLAMLTADEVVTLEELLGRILDSMAPPA